MRGISNGYWKAVGALLLVVAQVPLWLLAVDAWEQRSLRRARQAAVAATLAHADAALADGQIARALVGCEAARTLGPSEPSVQGACDGIRIEAAARQAPLLTAADLASVDWALSMRPEDSAVSLAAGATVALRRGDRRAAREQLEKALMKDPTLGAAAVALGDLARSEGRLPEAIGAYERAVAANAADPVALNNLGAAYVDAGRFDEGRAALETAIVKADSAASRLNLANALIGLGRLSDAVPHLREAANQDPASIVVARRLGVVLRSTGDLAGAESVLARALGPSTDPDTLFELALVHQAQRRFSLAAKELADLTEANPFHANATYQLAATLKTMGDHDTARRVMSRFMAITEGNPAEDVRRAEVEKILAASDASPPDSATAPPGGPESVLLAPSPPSAP